MKKKVIFFSSHEIALPALNFLISSDLVELSGIVSQADKPSGRGYVTKPTKISQFAKMRNIPLLTPMIPDSHAVDWMMGLGCDIIFVMAYGHILKKNILEAPKLGIYNFHASILPKYRGASPIETAIACGEKVTGMTLMQMVEEMDAGDVAAIKKVDIAYNDNYQDVMCKLANTSPSLLKENLNAICSGKAAVYKQNSAEATFTRKLSKNDGILDFNRPAAVLVNQINAFSPHIGAFADFGGELLRIGKATAENTGSVRCSPGKVVSTSSIALKVATSDGILLFHELQRPGKKMLKILEFLNGFPIKTGDVFISHAPKALISTAPHKNISFF